MIPPPQPDPARSSQDPARSSQYPAVGGGFQMTKQKVVVGDGKSGLGVVPTALFTTDVKKPPLMPGGYIKISKKKLLQNLEITSGARINAWVESMRASSPTFNRQDKTTWMVSMVESCGDTVVVDSCGDTVVLAVDLCVIQWLWQSV
ncbi:hypothetical protein Tco_1012368 [Tanacetum coccineum]